MTNGEEVAPPAPEAVGEGGGGGESMLHGSVGSLGGGELGRSPAVSVEGSDGGVPS